MSQTIFADNTYSKPFFVTYINTSLFILPLFTILFGRVWRLWRSGKISRVTSFRSLLRQLDSHDPDAETQGILHHEASRNSEDALDDPEAWNEDRPAPEGKYREDSKLGLRATAKLSFEFCMLWVRRTAIRKPLLINTDKLILCSSS